MSDMIPFGTVDARYCCVCSKTTSQILGSDDEWYCAVCDRTYFKNIVQHYKEPEQCHICGAAMRDGRCSDQSCEYNSLLDEMEDPRA